MYLHLTQLAAGPAPSDEAADNSPAEALPPKEPSPAREVLFVSHYPFYGGPQNRARRLAAPLAEAGWSLTVALPDEPGNAAARLRDNGVQVVQMPLSRLRAKRNPLTHVRFVRSWLPDIARLRRLIRESNAEVVVVAGLANPHAAIAAHLEGRAVVWQILDTRTPTVAKHAVLPFVRRMADVVMTTGTGLADFHPGVTKFGDRWIPFYSPVDLVQFRPDRARGSLARQRLGISPESEVVGLVGNITPQKGIEYFIAAARAIGASRPEATFLIVGRVMESHEAYRARIQAMIDRAGLPASSRLILCEPQGDVAELLNALDVFVLTSVPRSEGVPTVALEALASGLPVVATDVGGVREIIDSTCGEVVRPCQPNKIASAVLRILEDRELRMSLGGAARARACSDFGIEQSLSRHLEAFDQALRHRAGRN